MGPWEFKDTQNAELGEGMPRNVLVVGLSSDFSDSALAGAKRNILGASGTCPRMLSVRRCPMPTQSCRNGKIVIQGKTSSCIGPSDICGQPKNTNVCRWGFIAVPNPLYCMVSCIKFSYRWVLRRMLCSVSCNIRRRPSSTALSAPE